MSKLYEVPEDIAKVLRNAGINVITKHYIEQQGQQDEAAEFRRIHDSLPTPEEVLPHHSRVSEPFPKPKRRTFRKYKRDRLVEVGQYTPRELRLGKARRFYGDKAQSILLKRVRPVPRIQLLDLLLSGDKYHGDDNRNKVNSQIGHLLNLGVLQYKANGDE